MDLRFKLAPPEQPLPFDITEAKFLHALTRKKFDIGMPELESLSGYEAALKEFQVTLRFYVDLWISTGVSEDESEDLSARGHLRGEYFKHGQLLPHAHKKLRALDTVTTVVLETFGQRPQLHITAAGVEVVFSPYSPECEDDPLKGFAERTAKRFFTWFVASDLRRSLGKCPGCGDYDVKKRSVYKCGAYCRSCKQRVGAEKAVRRNRAELHKRRAHALSLALKEWEGEIDVRKRETRGKLTRRVNARLATDDRVKSNWVSRQLRPVRRDHNG